MTAPPLTVPLTRASWPWRLMAGLATAVAGYALFLLVRPDLGPPFVRAAPSPLTFAAHFAGGAMALLLGPWQFRTGPVPGRTPLHRLMGRAYGLSVLLSGVAGLLLATRAQEGGIARAGFGGLAVAWLVTLALAVKAARAHQVAEHRRWMVRNYALTFAAVTLRFYLPASFALGVDFAVSYPIIAWACWVPNAVVAEWMLRRHRSG